MLIGILIAVLIYQRRKKEKEETIEVDDSDSELDN